MSFSFANLLAVGIGGFFGAVSRFLMAGYAARLFGAGFPYGTLVVNVLGSFLLGFLSKFFLDKMVVNELLRVGLTIGFLGAFTTFSTFSNETVLLLQSGETLRAGINIAANCLICLTVCLLGLQLARMV